MTRRSGEIPAEWWNALVDEVERGGKLDAVAPLVLTETASGKNLRLAADEVGAPRRVVWYSHYFHVENVQVSPGDVVAVDAHVADVAAQVNSTDFGGFAHLHWELGDGVRDLHPASTSAVGATVRFDDVFEASPYSLPIADTRAGGTSPNDHHFPSSVRDFLRNRTRAPVDWTDVAGWEQYLGSTLHDTYAYYAIDFSVEDPAVDSNASAGKPVYNSVIGSDVETICVFVENVDSDENTGTNRKGWEVILRHELDLGAKAQPDFPLVGVWSRPASGFPTNLGYFSGVQFSDAYQLTQEGSMLHVDAAAVVVEEEDGTPSFAASIIQFDQAQGLRVSEPVSGTALVTILDASGSNPGVVSTGTQSFAGEKTFSDVNVTTSFFAADQIDFSVDHGVTSATTGVDVLPLNLTGFIGIQEATHGGGATNVAIWPFVGSSEADNVELIVQLGTDLTSVSADVLTELHFRALDASNVYSTDGCLVLVDNNNQDWPVFATQKGSTLRLGQTGETGAGDTVTGGIVTTLAEPELVFHGRLSLSSSDPTPATVSSSGTIYLHRFKGRHASLHDGTSWGLHELPATPVSVSSGATSGMHDVFLYDNSGTLTLEILAWTNDTTRATALALQDGQYVKSGDATRLYVGSFYNDASSTQVFDTESQRYLYNRFNQRARALSKVTGTSSWSIPTGSPNFRDVMGTTTMFVEAVLGLVECQPVELLAGTYEETTMASTTARTIVGVGVDSTTVNSAQVAPNGFTGFAGTEVNSQFARYAGHPGLGRHLLYALEYQDAGQAKTGYGSVVTGTESGLVGTIRN